MRQLAPLSIVAPGALGLNTEDSLTPLGPAYAVEALNAVIDDRGRLASREGLTTRTTGTPAADAIRQLFEYRKASGVKEIIASWDGGIANSIVSPGASDISGTVTVSDGNWQFVNFNDEVWGAHANVAGLIRYTGSGTFTAPVVQKDGGTHQSGILCAAFGRLWTLESDGKTIAYSALLDGTDFREVSGGGRIDTSKIWTQGTDRVRALAAFNGALIAFGERHLIFWVDGQGSALGLDPTLMYVSDVIEGTGLLGRDTIQAAGETDLVFLSPTGVQSLSRIVQERSAPVDSLTDHNRTALLAAVDAAGDAWSKLRSAYDPENGFYILSCPSASSAYTYVLDLSRRFRDDQGRALARMTRWTIAPTALAYTSSGLLASSLTAGKVAVYEGADDEGTNFEFSWLSPWLDMGEEIASRLKIPKNLKAVVNATSNSTIEFVWAFDFETQYGSRQATLTVGSVAEWGTAEWGIGQWGAAFVNKLLDIPMSGEGQFVQLGVNKTVGTGFALQQIRVYAKIGRMV